MHKRQLPNTIGERTKNNQTENRLVVFSLSALDKQWQVGMPHFADVYEQLPFMVDFMVHRHLQKLPCRDFRAEYVREI